MQGNDLGSWTTGRNVVVLEPLLVRPPEERSVGQRAAALLSRKAADKQLDDWVLNQQMCAWITQSGFRFSVPTEIWSFLPEHDFNILQPRVDRVCGKYISEWVCWGSLSEAYTRLRSSSDILAVYDADVERLERYWHFRGVRVPLGSAP